jgi:predicted alpha/beta-hydrolase family hydrolase
MTFTFLHDGPDTARATVLLAHGAGAPMDSAAMQRLASALADAGLRVVRFEFAYMAARRAGQRRPPPKGEALIPEYRAAVAALGAQGTLIVGGKSMGGRIASMVADELWAEGSIAGLLCLGYPFHPPAKPAQVRTAHLKDLRTPSLIAQGTRDPFGTRDDVTGYDLSPAIDMLWLEDGDHDLRPRKGVSGFTLQDHLATLGHHVAGWAQRIAPRLR